MRLLLLFTILGLVACHSNPPLQRSDKDVDSIFAELRSPIEPRFHQLDFPPIFRYFDSIASFIRIINDDRLTSRWLSLKSAMMLYSERKDSAHFYALEAHKTARKIGPANRYLIEAKTALLRTFTSVGAYDSALAYGMEAYHLAKQIDVSYVPRVNNYLSEVYEATGDILNSRKYLFEGYSLADDPYLKLTLANHIAYYYFKKNQLDSVRLFQEKVIRDSVFNINLRNKIALISNVGTLLSQAGALDQGLTYFLEVVRLEREIGLSDVTHYLNIAQNYSLLGQYKPSNAYIDTALTLARSESRFDILADAYRLLGSNLGQQNRPAGAYAALDSFNFYFAKNDSLAYVQKAQELEVRYAVKEKDERISNLEYTNRTNRKIRAQQRLILFALIILLFALVVIGVMLWRRRQLKTQLHEIELEQQVLRSQMDPHFIFNTLTALRSFVQGGHTEKAKDYILKLSQLLRLSFDNASKSIIPIQDEIIFLQNYLSLQVIQFEDRFEYDVQVYPEFEEDNVLIPPMILQPLIENTIVHGFSNIDYIGLLSVKIERVENSLICTIEDNGRGFQSLTEMPRSTIHAMEIVKQRLRLLNHKTRIPASVTIIDKPSNALGPGVLVTVTIPFIQRF